MSYRKLGRTSSQRKALLRDLTSSLLIHGQIVTTEARAKEIRSTTDKMITLGKRGDLHARRQAAAFLRNPRHEDALIKQEGDTVVAQSLVQKLFSEIAPKYADRKGGYTRTLKTAPRRGDGAAMVLIQLV